MINKNSIILAEPIVLSQTAPLVNNASDIIKGLMELSHGALPYSDHYRDEIVEVTADNGHTELMEEVSTSLAEAIRSTFSQVSTFGIGFARVLASELGNYSRNDYLIDDATGGLTMRFVNLDNDFLISTLYPTGPKNTQFTYNAIDMGVLGRLQFNTDLIDELASTYVDTQHPDVIKVMKDEDAGGQDAFYNIMRLDDLQGVFHHNGNIFDFTQIKSYNLPMLFKMYIVVSKMYASEDPIKALVGGSLTDYREYVALLWNGLSTYLAALKTRVNLFRARGIAIHQQKLVTLRKTERQFQSSNDKLEFLQLNGEVTVFYTKPVVETLQQNKYCLRDWVIGRLLCDLNGKGNVEDSALFSGCLLQDTLEDFYRVIRDGMKTKQRDLCEFLFQRAVNTFVNGNAELKAHIDAMEEEGIGSEKIVLIMNEDFKNGHNLSVTIDNHPEMDMLDVVMCSGVITRFLKAIGCKLAADIIKHTEHHSDVNDQVEKRKRLHYAVTKVLAEKLLG